MAPCDGSVNIHTDEGRIVRPLLTVSRSTGIWVRPQHRAPTDVAGLLADRLLRYVDAAEISMLDVALDTQTVLQRCKNNTPVDLLEVHAHLILGVTAALIPLLQSC